MVEIAPTDLYFFAVIAPELQAHPYPYPYPYSSARAAPQRSARLPLPLSLPYPISTPSATPRQDSAVHDYTLSWAHGKRTGVVGPIARLDLEHRSMTKSLFRETRPKLVLVLADAARAKWSGRLPGWFGPLHRKQIQTEPQPQPEPAPSPSPSPHPHPHPNLCMCHTSTGGTGTGSSSCWPTHTPPPTS